MHALHESLDLAASDVENLPATQAVHWASEVSPNWADHLPAEHRLLQALEDVCPCPDVENLPATQVVHWALEVSSVTDDHLPAEHPWHADDAGSAMRPTGQFPLVYAHAFEPDTEKNPTPHGLH